MMEERKKQLDRMMVRRTCKKKLSDEGRDQWVEVERDMGDEKCDRMNRYTEIGRDRRNTEIELERKSVKEEK